MHENTFNDIRNYLFYYLYKYNPSNPIKVRCLLKTQSNKMYRITMINEILYIENLLTHDGISILTNQLFIDLKPKHAAIKITGGENRYEVIC